MAQKQISRFPLNEKFSGLSEHVPNYGHWSVFNYCKYRYQRQACFFEIYCFYFFTVIFTNTFFYMEVIHMKMLVVRYHTVQYPVL